MNSWSRKDYYDDDCEPCKKKEKEEKSCQTIIKCGCPGSTTLPAATAAGTTFTLASLSLDTSKLKNPCIKLEFASNIVAAAFLGSLRLQVFKLCSNQTTPIPVGPSWTLSEAAAITSGRTFSFFVCDCDSCFKDCCTYTVIATTNLVTAGVITINNATLGAVATCGSGC